MCRNTYHTSTLSTIIIINLVFPHIVIYIGLMRSGMRSNRDAYRARSRLLQLEQLALFWYSYVRPQRALVLSPVGRHLQITTSRSTVITL
jgi:hypothetical protein